MKNSRETVQHRQQEILNYLRKNQYAEVSYLAHKFNITSMTMRRDLDTLEEKGAVIRFHGSVKYALSPDIDVKYKTPQGNPTPYKMEIAKKAASLIEEDDTIFLNSSSTAGYVLNYLSNKRALVITNNSRTIFAERDPLVELILTGGIVYGNKGSLVGEISTSAIAGITANKCILGVSGISLEYGITSTISQETAINQLMVSHCTGKRIVVADGGKIGKKRNFFSGDITCIDMLITDKSADPYELDKLRQAGIEIIIVDE